MSKFATVALVILMFITNKSTAGFLINPSFEEGRFAVPGDANYNIFASGVTGTIIYPGQDTLTGWVVALSPYDPDGLITAVPGFGFGLEWVNLEYGSYDGSRLLDLNRGGDLYKVSQSINTISGNIYDINYYGLGGSLFYGATTEIKVVGNSILAISNDTTVMTPEDSSAWQRFTLRFTADSSTTTINLTARNYGADPGSGMLIDEVSVNSINPIPVPPAIIVASISCVLLLSASLRTGWSVRRESTHQIGR